MISKKALIICVLVIAVLAGAYLFLTLGGQESEAPENIPEPSTQQAKLNPIYEAELDSFVSLTVKNNRDSYELYLSDGVWSVKGYENILFSQINVNNTLFGFVSVIPTLVVSESSENKASYGFDNPQAEVEIKTNDGKTTEFYLGDMTKGGNGYYLMMSGDDSVYTVSTILGNSMLKTLFDYRETTVVSVVPEEITGIVMTVQGVGEVCFEKLENKSEVMSSWTMTKPYEIGVYDDKFTEAVLTPLTSVSVEEFVSDNPTDKQLGESGLVNPEIYYEIKTVDKSYRVNIGKSFDGYLIAKRSDLPSVFLLNPDSLTFLFTNIIDYISSYVYLPAHDSIAELDINAGDEKYLLLNGEEITFNGNPVSQKTYSELYQGFFGIPIKGQVTTTPETEEAYLSYKATLNDGTVDNISFVPMNSKYMYMFVNDKTEFYVFSKDVEAAKNALSDTLKLSLEEPYEGEEETSQAEKTPGGIKWLGLLIVVIVFGLIIVFPVSMLKNSGNKK